RDPRRGRGGTLAGRRRHRRPRPLRDDPLEAYPVSTAVNDPTNESPEVIDPIDTEQSGFEEFTD
ncbi:MAG: SOS response-associated peptidase, partial [Haloarculaceae archaeon]